jgi:hypothetical protein
MRGHEKKKLFTAETQRTPRRASRHNISLYQAKFRTDFRRAGESEGAVVNPMIECSCDRVVRTTKKLLETVSHLF